MDNSPKTKLLIVDDIKANLLSMHNLLEHQDYEILTAQSGNDALSMMLENEFALVLLDVQMPGMNGFEVAELMRSRDVLNIFR